MQGEEAEAGAAESDGRRVLEQGLAIARKLAPGAEALFEVRQGRDANTRFARSEMTSNGDVEETRVSIYIAEGKRHASVEINQIEPAALRAAVESAVRLARISPEDPEAMPVLGAQEYGAAAVARDPGAEALEAEARASAIDAALRAGDAAKLEIAGLYQHSARHTLLGSSAGLFAEHRSTAVSCSVTARYADGSGSGWAGAESHRAAGVDAGALAAVAVDKALRTKSPRALAPGRYTVVLEPAAVSDLLGPLAFGLDARPADEGRSFFSKKGGGTKVSEKLFSELVTLRSDPRNPELPSAPFDNEGFPLQPTAWIEKGTLRGLHTSRYWAKKSGGKPTGRSVSYSLDPGASSPAELIEGVKRGVLITRFFYIRMVDPRQLLLTGLTRDGVFLIEDGKVVAPVNNFRFNESPAALLKNVEAVGKLAARPGGGFIRLRVPGLRAGDFNLASVSDAI